MCLKEKWVALLSSEYPTMAYRASIKNPFGRGALINLLRQFGKVRSAVNEFLLLVHMHIVMYAHHFFASGIQNLLTGGMCLNELAQYVEKWNISVCDLNR